jgi:type II secretory pathway pseudopilin PulG
MAALLVTIAVMAIMMTVAMPVWRQQARREKEAELIFRAGQYVHAIELYKRKFGNAYPTNIDVLIKSRFLRRKFTDPMTKDGEFRLLTPQELNATPTRMLNLPGAGNAGRTDNRLGTGTAIPGQGISTGGSVGAPPATGTGAPGAASGSGLSDSNAANDPSKPAASSGPGGTIQIGPIAAVASKSTEQSIRIFKGRDHYNQWIVTIDDVVPRQFLRQQQPNQPGQAPGNNNPGRQSSPGSTSPTSSSPTSSSPFATPRGNSP